MISAPDYSFEVKDTDWSTHGETLKARDLAGILGLKPPTALLRLRNGIVPAHWIGGSWIIFTAEVRTHSAAPDTSDGSPDVLVDYPDPLPLDDLTRLFGKNRQTVNRWLRDATIPSYRPGKQYFVPKDLLYDLLERTSNQVEAVLPALEGGPTIPDLPPSDSISAPKASQPSEKPWLERTLAEIAEHEASARDDPA